MDSFLKAMGVLFLLGVGGCGILAIVGGKAAHEVQQEMRRSQPTHTIGLAQFNRIKEGMTYDQVVGILGAQGEVISETTIGEGQYRTHTVMYQWNAGLMANMNCMFQNNALISKAQFGLK